jgi:hypothetical protein
MLLHALATLGFFLLFLLNCVQVGKFKIPTPLTTRFKVCLAQFTTSGMGLAGGISRASGYFWEQFEKRCQ